MLDFIGTIGVGIFFCVWLVALLGAMQITLKSRLALAALAGIWVGLAAYLGAAGEFDDVARRPVPLVAVMVFTPLILTALVVWLSPAARQALLSIPLPLMIGLNAMRLIGGLFLLLAVAGRLGGPFPYSAGCTSPPLRKRLPARPRSAAKQRGTAALRSIHAAYSTYAGSAIKCFSSVRARQ